MERRFFLKALVTILALNQYSILKAAGLTAEWGGENSLQNNLNKFKKEEVIGNVVIYKPIIMPSHSSITSDGGGLINEVKGSGILMQGVSNVAVSNLALSGVIENGPESGGNAGYAINAINSSRLKIQDVSSRGYNGTVLFTNVKKSTIKNVVSKNNKYHPESASGGYGVLLQACEYIVIDGVHFEANVNEGDLGRHCIYVSLDKKNPNRFCKNITIKNVVSNKSNLNDRNMCDVMIRKCQSLILSDFEFKGSNGGIVLNPEQGDINDILIANGVVNIEQYESKLPVYGIAVHKSTGKGTVNRLTLKNIAITISEAKDMVKDNGEFIRAMVAISSNANFVSFIDLVIHSYSNISPVHIGSGNEITIDNIKDDFILGKGMRSFISFTGPVYNVKISNINTKRKLFDGLDNVTDMTVDFKRQVTLSRGIDGNIDVTDVDSILDSYLIESTGTLRLTFKKHVTERSVNHCSFQGEAGANDIRYTSPVSKQILIRVTNPDGTQLVDLRSIQFSFSVTINS